MTGAGATVTLEWESEAVARLTLDRPDAANSINAVLAADLYAAAREVRFSGRAKAAIVTGRGRFFCAGADLKEHDKAPGWIWDLRRAIDELEAMELPVVAAINGPAMGGGAEIALACDIRLAARSIRIGLPEIKFGALPGAGGPQRLVRLVGPGWAKRLVMTGEALSAEAAAAIGLVEEVVDDDDLQGRASELAATLAAHARYALSAAKFAIDRGAGLPLQEGLALGYRLIDEMGSEEEFYSEVEKAIARDPTYARIFRPEP